MTNIGNGAFENCDYLTIVYFLGNAPTVGSNVFYDDYSATAYYLSGATGWGATFGGIPTVMLNSSAPTGSLQVTIAPLGAINAGSQWQIFVNQTYWWYPEMNIGSYGSGATDTNLLTGVSYLVTPVAGSGYNFIGWSGDATGDANPLTITATSNMVITANFAPDTTNVNLIIITTGNGVVSPNMNGKNLKPNAPYTLTAIAASGWVFSNWTGSLTMTNRNPLIIKTDSSIVLQANFVTNPFLAPKGSYNGLFSAAAGVSTQSAGMLKNLTVGTNGVYSGSLVINGTGHSFSGKFDLASPSATNVIPFPNSLGGPLTVNLTLTNNPANAAPQVAGTVANNNWTANLLADLAANTLPSGEYTLLIPPDASNNPPTDSPGGYGYALITNYAGTPGNPGLANAKITGALADGTAFNQTVPVSQDGYVPIYASLYQNQGLLFGWINLDPTNTSGVNLTWIRPAIPAALYWNGFTNILLTNQILFSPWTNSPASFDTLSNLSLPGTNIAVSISAAGRITGPSVSGTVNPKTGLLTVTNGSGNNKVQAHGAILPNAASGAGYFLTKTNALPIQLTP